MVYRLRNHTGRGTAHSPHNGLGTGCRDNLPAVNKIAGFETRGRQTIHWWTFYGWFMEIDDGLFSQVLSIRQKLAKGKKLEKWEQEFLRNNQKLCELKGAANGTQGDYEFFAELLGRGE